MELCGPSCTSACPPSLAAGAGDSIAAVGPSDLMTDPRPDGMGGALFAQSVASVTLCILLTEGADYYLQPGRTVLRLAAPVSEVASI